MNETVVMFMIIFGVPFCIGTIIWALKQKDNNRFF